MCFLSHFHLRVSTVRCCPAEGADLLMVMLGWILLHSCVTSVTEMS